MWIPFRCRLFGEHDYQLRREPRALCLECRRCGHRSQGWNLPDQRLKRANNGLRLNIADPGYAIGPVRVVETPSGHSAGFMSSDSLRLTFAEEGKADRRRMPIESAARGQIVIDSPVG